MATPHRLLADALALPTDEREELLRALIDSLDGPANAGDPGEAPDAVAAAWDAEIERRLHDDEADDVDGPAALRRLRAEMLGR